MAGEFEGRKHVVVGGNSGTGRAAAVQVVEGRGSAVIIGHDLGTSYGSAIFYVNDEQRQIAADTVADIDASGLSPGRVVTRVRAARPCWEAQPERQDYLQRNPDGYTSHVVRPQRVLPEKDGATRA